MNINEVIKYPILSEKSYKQMETRVYSFAVDFRTNKAEVKKVVEHIFDVKVEKVNIMTVNKKEKKLGKFQGYTNRYKKAIVTLKDGEVINIFPDEAETTSETKETKKVEVKKETKKVEISEVEKKAAAKIETKAKEVKKEVKPKPKTKAKLVEKVKTEKK